MPIEIRNGTVEHSPAGLDRAAAHHEAFPAHIPPQHGHEHPDADGTRAAAHPVHRGAPQEAGLQGQGQEGQEAEGRGGDGDRRVGGGPGRLFNSLKIISH